ncbi:CpaF family protein [Dietzia cercidiphylli]|uniref:CpaF family protein n=1 Tax=Dietzia cercidiphylli TaxID=498199 RepID=UPI00223C3EB6|nr:ATPase, T2SS/T4P/T4SS family [Dietzia cercidiphylli]MCT1516511.1 Flp pilus assembly complex ATPase component TadA [Dietzia cercidiphylli]
MTDEHTTEPRLADMAMFSGPLPSERTVADPVVDQPVASDRPGGMGALAAAARAHTPAVQDSRSAQSPPPLPTLQDTPVPAQVAPPADQETALDEVDKMGELDQVLVGMLKQKASEVLTSRQRARDERVSAARRQNDPLPVFTQEDREVEGADIAQKTVDSYVEEIKNLGRALPSINEQQRLVKALFDELFRLGPLQPLIELPDVENILINGDEVQIMRPDGSTYQVKSPFGGDQELIDWLQNMASRSGGGGRVFAPTSPGLRLNLPGGIRLSALAWTTNAPSVAIRLHRHKDIDLPRLTSLGVMDPRLEPLLAGMVSSDISIVISGPMGSGKTTLLRALVAALPIETRIGVAETERELFLEELAGRAPFVVSSEVIEGGGERNPVTGQREGSFSLDDQLYEYVRQQLERVIVGEVAGKEIIALFKAMQMAKGALTTTHADTARGAINRLVTCAMEVGVTHEYAERQVAEHVDLIVQLDTKWTYDEATGERRSHRFIKSVDWVESDSDDARPKLTHVYEGGPDGDGLFGTFPQPLRERLAGVGITSGQIPANQLTTRQPTEEGQR